MRDANAGHPRPLHVRRDAGQIVPLVNASGKSQPALGLTETVVYHSSELILSPGDLVFLFTDGLVGGQNPDNQFYTQAMLAAALQERLALPTSRLFDEILEVARRFG